MQEFYGLEVFAGFGRDGSFKNGVKQFTRRDPDRTGRLSSRLKSGGFFLKVFVDAMEIECNTSISAVLTSLSAGVLRPVFIDDICLRKYLPFDTTDTTKTGLNMSGQKPAIPGSRTYHEVAAYHEAGHAVAALLLGIRIVEVRIDHQRPGAGQTVYWVTRPPLEGSREPWTIAPSRWARSLSREQRRAVFALAGPLAEARLLGKPMRTHGSIGDLESVHQLMRWPETQGDGQPHGAVRSEAKLFFEAEIRRTRRILNQPPVWHAVTVIAGDLLSWGSLRSDDVAETVQWALGGCRQMGLFTGMNNMSGTAAPRKHDVRARFNETRGPFTVFAMRLEDENGWRRRTTPHPPYVRRTVLE